jgi:hypothetical protein
MSALSAHRRPDRKVPDCDQLKRLVSRGLTQQEIADWTRENLGERVTRSAIGQALRRCGIESAHPRPRYEREVPWDLPMELQAHPVVRQLRLLGRENRGEPITDEERRRLGRLKAWLDEKGASVHYDADHSEKILFVPRRDGETYVRAPDQP